MHLDEKIRRGYVLSAVDDAENLHRILAPEKDDIVTNGETSHVGKQIITDCPALRKHDDCRLTNLAYLGNDGIGCSTAIFANISSNLP